MRNGRETRLRVPRVSLQDMHFQQPGGLRPADTILGAKVF